MESMERRDTPITIPKKWQKTHQIANEIIKKCPFCNGNDNNANACIGTREHLHLYCNMKTLIKTREHCNQKIELALFDIYDYASKLEYNQLLQRCNCLSKLQEDLERVASNLEKTERLLSLTS